jgi:hypothetical protein
MNARFWKQLAVILRRLSPGSVQREANRPFSLAVVGTGEEVCGWRDRLAPPGLAERKRDQALKPLFTIPVPLTPAYAEMLPRFDLLWVTPSAVDEVRGLTRRYTLLPEAPDGGAEESAWADAIMDEVRDKHAGFRLALARHYHPLRRAAISQVISTIALENAAFAVLSAIPDIIPSPVELPWAIGEFASDTVVITANQLRMAFIIAAASDSPVGWSQQKGQLASIAGSAFGWRALARELAGKMPGGAGLVAKGLIAYSATHVVGWGLEHFHRLGHYFTRPEKLELYQEAHRRGRKRVEELERRLAGRGPAPRPAAQFPGETPEAASGAWLPEAE